MRLRVRFPVVAVLALLGACAQAAPTAPTVPQSCAGIPGTPCFGERGYIEYVPGDLPIVISVPHGGAVAPATIPDRTGTTVTDLNTIELGRAIAQALAARGGRAPHLVVCHLRRTKLDANRDLADAAQGNAEATVAWREYHAFVEQATAAVARQYVRGFYIDLHGHGHAIPRLELGYLLSAADLDRTDAELNGGGFAAASSLRRLTLSQPFAEVLRGPTSLGGLLEPDFPSVPGPSAPSPGADPYFTGGYSTSRHTAALPGVQIEAHFTGVRDSAASRSAFASALATALATFAALHLDLTF